MKTRTIARFAAAVLFALTLALTAMPAPAAQAAEGDWQRLPGSCTVRATSGMGNLFLGGTTSQLITTTTSTSWTFYRSGSYYALELGTTGKFITATSKAGQAPGLQVKSTTNPNSQLWDIQKSGSVYTFKNVATSYYIFVISSTPMQYLSNKTTFYMSGTGCSSYYSY